ncbi:sensor histidine kinase [Agromyces laixinhei]|uniref:sensor histidine kinase n=2 Tax=Agromyces laixinhei TaxID=2585717 RepID=UPI001115B26C|nr:ATP-binding protein [Agromyces laixinhei]
MTLGLPGHLARESLSRALRNAGHCAAFACLGMAAALVAVVSLLQDRSDRWIGFALAVGMMVLLALVARYATVTLTVVYLVAGAGALLALTVLVLRSGEFPSTNNAVLALVGVALLLVGGAGNGSTIAIIWATLGFALGQVAMLVGAVVTGGVFMSNAATCFAFVVVVIVRVFDGLTRRAGMRRETGLHRASQQTRELAIRHDYELRATARLHDTALSHLVAIAAAGSGPVDERLRAGIRQDLGLVVGRDWAIDHASSGEAGDREGVGGAKALGERQLDDDDGHPPAESDVPPLDHSFTAAENAGLRVRVTGDVAVLGTLGPRRAAALDAAVAQCLINVARHSGVDEAELALGLGGGEVTIAVMDSGIGFDEAQVAPDRIGLRTSIRARIEQEHGTVRLWSSRGIGTTVVLTVPEGGA